MPAVVLCFATGLFYKIYFEVSYLKIKALESNFGKFTKALGLSPKRVLFRLVVFKALIDAWTTSLPWIFGEILVVEALFNAPGLGLDIWHMARMRDLSGFIEGVSWLLAIYFVLRVVSFYLSKTLGRRLDGYNL